MGTDKEQKPLEMDRRIEKSEMQKDWGNVLFEEIWFDFGLIRKYCITIKMGKKHMPLWFDASKRDAAFNLWDALFNTENAPIFIKGPDYREV